MRKSKLQLYSPFLALLALLQVAFVVLAPSEGETTDPLAQLSTGAGGSAPGPAFGDATADGASPGAAPTGAVTPGATTPGATGTSPTPGAAPGTGAPSSTAPGATSGGGTATGAPQAAAGDTSHCVGERQTDVITAGPRCAPVFVGDNGGATYPGVTATEIKLVNFQCQPNEQVDALLASQGLASTQAETEAMIDATVDWMNVTYEFYGRTLVWENVIGDCTLTPPDPAKSRQAAAEVAKTQPAFVIHGTGGPDTHDVWAQNGIISLGGPAEDNSFFAGRRPFRWDLFPNGTETADWIAEYYCKKLADKPAANAGPLIHPTIGGRTTTRRLGILTFDNGNGTTLPNAQRAKAAVEQCSGQADVPILLYESDINRAEEQTRATVAKLVNEKITSLVCLCDPIAPVFLTNGMTRNNYFPEHILSGAYLTDYDLLGRLYDPVQWSHAFGPSQLTDAIPHEQSNATKIWRAAGREGTPCASCNLITGYVTLIGSMIQSAGPNLNPLTVEQGLVGNRESVGGWEETGGNPFEALIRFGPDDYTAISDFREVYWSATTRSAVDNRPGAYISLNGGRRYTGGQLDGSFAIPPAAR